MREATGRTEPLAAIAPARPAALRRGKRVGFWSLAAGARSGPVAAPPAPRARAVRGGPGRCRRRRRRGGARGRARRLSASRGHPLRRVPRGRCVCRTRSDPAGGRCAAPRAGMTDPALVARVRAEVAVGIDPAGLLAAYAEPARRALLRERVRVAARVPVGESEIDAMCAELFGFGPLQPLLDDPEVTDVLVNGPRDIFCERSGRLERADVAFRGPDDVAELAHRIAGSVGRELTLERPFVDARMRDGSRANAVIAPIGGPSLSIRKFNRLSIPLRGPAPSWVASGMHDDAACLLEACVRERASIVVSGATGSGNRQLLRSLAAAIPDDERLVVIEDTNELVLPHSHVVHLECVPARDGSGIGIADLVANALRMRPDRILVGEVRTPREASALLEALSTGHEGSLTTIHAGSAAGAIDRLALLLARAGELGEAAIARQVAQGIDILVHVVRDRAGSRSVREIAAIEDGGVTHLWRAGELAVRMPARLRQRLV